jgi:PKD repeat protein
LYAGDGSHPSRAGSYAAACSFYSLIFEKNPVNISFNYGLADSIADQIKQAAKIIAFDKLTKWNVGAYDPEAQFSFVNTDSVFSFTHQATHADSYYWDFGDGDTSAVENPVHHYAAGGSYQVLLVVEKCGKRDSLEQTISFSGTGIFENEFAASIRIFPNPSDGFITFEGIDLSSSYPIMLTDLSGKKISGYNLTDKNVMDVSKLASGPYFIQIKDLSGKMFMGKFLKK